MSFLSNPSKYLREALEERSRQKALEAHRKKLRGHHHHGAVDTSPEPEPSSAPAAPASTWKSISNFLPVILSPKALDPEDEDERRMRREHQHQPAEAALPLAVGASPDSTQREAEDVEEVAADYLEKKSMKSQLEAPELTLTHDVKDEDESLQHQPFGLPEDIPSEPIYFSDQSECWGPFRCHRYNVSRKLMNSYARQSLFLQRVMSLLTLQYALLLAWVGIVMSVPKLGDTMKEYFTYSYIPLGIFIVSKLLLRSMVRIRKLEPLPLLCISFGRVLCAAYYFGAVSVVAKTELILLSGIIVTLSLIFFTLTPAFVEYNVGSSEIVGMGAVINLSFALLITIPFVILKYEGSSISHILLMNWLPSAVLSELILIMLVFDMKQIMSGWRFPLGEADWVFTVLYL